MSLGKRAVGGIVVASSLVMMCTAAETVEAAASVKLAATAETRTDLDTNGTAGVVACLGRIRADAFRNIQATKSVTLAREEAGTEAGSADPLKLVRDSEAAAGHAELADTGTGQPAGASAAYAGNSGMEGISAVEGYSDSEDMRQAGTGDAQEPVESKAASQAGTGDAQEPVDSKDACLADAPEAESAEDGKAADTWTEEELAWQNRLMADVESFLYVRQSGDPEAEIVGKMYKGDVAEIVEVGDTWTHIVSGNVDGYVKNDYCVSGLEALEYASERFDVEAESQTDGLRVRSGADTESAVITAVSAGTAMTVDTSVETDGEWVAVKYGGETAYVSAEYVKTDLALGEAVTIAEEMAEAEAQEAAAKTAAATASAQQTSQNAAVAASADDVTLLAALIQCEAGSECYEGQVAVGAVVMNRVRSGGYPGSIYGVVYQSGQFSPAGSGSVASVAARGPMASCIRAAQQAIGGADNTGGATSFRRASAGQAGVVIGNHVFY